MLELLYAKFSSFFVGFPIDKVLKRLNMHEAEKRFLPMSRVISLSKTKSPTTSDERGRMDVIDLH